jgi:cytochrome c
MKYYLIAVLIFVAACKGGTGKTEDITKDSTHQIVNTGGTEAGSEKETGARLIAANDCFTCHLIDKKNIGPSYREVANHYDNNQGNIENLAHKIIKGGKGLWGQVPMTPHPNLSQQNAEEMVRYILSLRNAAGEPMSDSSNAIK